MSVNDEGSREQLEVQASQTVFPFPFRIFTENGLKVYWVDSSDVSTLLTYSTDYTLTGINDNNGGTVTLTGSVAVQTGDVIILQRDEANNKPPEYDYENRADFTPQLLDENTDKQFVLIQQINDKIDDRALLYPEDVVLYNTQREMPVLNHQEVWVGGSNNNIVALELSEDVSCSTLRSDLLQNSSDSNSGATNVGYYDTEDSPAETTVHAKLKSMHGFLPPISSDIAVVKDATHNDKLLKFDLTTLSLSTTRTITMPDNDVSLAYATETEPGLTEIATQAEVDAGTDDTKYVTPLTLKNSTHVETTDMFAFANYGVGAILHGEKNLSVAKYNDPTYGFQYLVYTFDTPRTDSDYVVILDLNNSNRTIEPLMWASTYTAGGFRVYFDQATLAGTETIDHMVRVYADSAS